MTHSYSKIIFGAAHCAALAMAMAAGIGTAFAQEDGARYAETLADADITARYNVQIEQQLRSQQSKITNLEQQIAGLDATAVDVQPLLQRMFNELTEFVENDVPFLAAERTSRIERLTELMANTEATSSEKFRRLMEAYQIEMEFGRTMSAYKETMKDGREAEFVRVGRVALLYRTADGEESGYWDNQQKSWVPDPASSSKIEEALRIAKEEIAADLITIPVPAPQGEGS
jgi:predicted 3-demethylubiquinone-9 3-methyltransferase (glyoxalase superfamily)